MVTTDPQRAYEWGYRAGLDDGYRRGWEVGEARAVSREQLALPAEYGRPSAQGRRIGKPEGDQDAR